MAYRGYICQSCNVVVGMIERRKFPRLPKVETCVEYIAKWIKFYEGAATPKKRSKRWREKKKREQEKGSNYRHAGRSTLSPYPPKERTNA